MKSQGEGRQRKEVGEAEEREGGRRENREGEKSVREKEKER